jgi:hypothetical protein
MSFNRNQSPKSRVSIGQPAAQAAHPGSTEIATGIATGRIKTGRDFWGRRMLVIAATPVKSA